MGLLTNKTKKNKLKAEQETAQPIRLRGLIIIITWGSDMNGTSIFSLYFTKERESNEGQVIGAYIKKCVFSMPFTFLEREIVLLTEEDSPDKSTKQQTVTHVCPQETGMVGINMYILSL